MTMLSALLLAYMVGLLLLALTWGTAYALPQWVLIGMMVTGSAVLLAWQLRRIRAMRRNRRDE